MINATVKNQIKTYLKSYGKNNTYSNIGRMFGVSEESARGIHRRMLANETSKVKTIKNHIEVQEYITDLEEKVMSFSENIKDGTAETTVSVKDEIKTLEELISKCNIDTSIWEVTKYVQNFWGGNYQVKAFLSKKSIEDLKLEKFQKFLQTYKSPRVSIPSIRKGRHGSKALVLSLCDFHIDKKDIDAISIEHKVSLYEQTVNSIINDVSSIYNLDEIIFIIGNDLFQYDDVLGNTVKGTKVEFESTYDNSYEIAFDLMVRTISKLKTYTNTVNIVLVPGNHSESKEYFLAHALSTFFKATKGINFQRTSDKYKCHVYGNTSLFLNHGDNITDKLPLMFAETFRKEWGATQFHEILLGHYHNNNERTYKLHKSQAETQGVRMRVLPTITGIDVWHYDNLFTNSIQAGIGLVYDKKKGKCAEFEHRI